ncbi:MAG: hypothetical protein ABIS50_24300 [Luteolibacter sp.]|uniref:hypothetical protein n=1 Tax=Luteolibacter sp. TaxID=1962973 RepID=UPI003263D7F2
MPGIPTRIMLCELLGVPEALSGKALETKMAAFKADLANLKSRAAEADTLETENETLRAEAARVMCAALNHDGSREHDAKDRFSAIHMKTLALEHLKGRLHQHPLASLPKEELRNIHTLLIKPFFDAWEALCE